MTHDARRVKSQPAALTLCAAIAALACVTLAGCSDSTSNGNLDLGFRDGGGQDMPGFLDRGQLSDNGGPLPDVSGPAPDAAPLKSLLDGPFHEYSPAGPDDLSSLVDGGAAPLTCTVYTGPGRGMAPSELLLTGCTLSGGFAADDPPGLYGFIIEVRDSKGQVVEIPVAVKNGDCNTAVGTLAPAIYPPIVAAPGTAQTWKVTLTDVDTPCTDASCTFCGGCVNHGVGTKLPLKLASAGDCANPGDLCVANGDIVNPTACPNTTPMSWSADILLNDHAPLRTDGGAAWITVESDATYSGTKTGFDCGDKTWSCHWELLER